MSKPTAAHFAAQGAKYLDTPYSKMDCQAFVEQCLADVGVKRDWKGSNDMYRKVKWISPVSMAKDFLGGIPAGALLFIWANDHGEVARGYTDGLGNASHVGICTGNPGDKGAIHSSSSRGCVAWSKFQNKEISGGWNYVGLLEEVDYGDKINAIRDEEEPDRLMADALIVSGNGKPVNMRSAPSTTAKVIKQLPVGTKIIVVEQVKADWYKCCFEEPGTDGYVMADYLQLLADPEDDEPISDYDEEQEMKTMYIATAEVHGGKLNLRAFPGTNSKAVASIPDGTKINVIDFTNDDWYNVEHDGKEGFVMKKYLTNIHLIEPEPTGQGDTVSRREFEALRQQVSDLTRAIDGIIDSIGGVG